MPDSTVIACHGCGKDIGFLMLSGVAVKYGDDYFCSEACLEEWIDSVQDKHNDDAEGGIDR